MNNSVEARTFTGQPDSLCVSRDSLQRNRAALAEVANSGKVGVKCMFFMFNATRVPWISPPVDGQQSSNHIVNIRFDRGLWEIPWSEVPAGLGEERNRIPEIAISKLVETLNTKCEKKLHKKASTSKYFHTSVTFKYLKVTIVVDAL